MSYQQPPGYGAPAAPPPGWYPDPYGPLAVRWWDGAQWTAHAQLLPEQAPRPQPSATAPLPPVAYDAFAGAAAVQSPPWAWAVAAAPLVQLGIAILVSVLTSPGGNGLGCLLAGAVVAFPFAIFAASRDVRALRAAGEDLNPALAWWCLLVPWAYLWARAVKRPGRTNADWGLLAGSVAAWLLVIVISSAVIGAATAASATFNQAATQAQIARGLEAQTGVPFKVSCPANPPVNPGSQFKCIATAAIGSSTVVTVTFQDRQGDVFWQGEG